MSVRDVWIKIKWIILLTFFIINFDRVACMMNANSSTLEMHLHLLLWLEEIRIVGITCFLVQYSKFIPLFLKLAINFSCSCYFPSIASFFNFDPFCSVLAKDVLIVFCYYLRPHYNVVMEQVEVGGSVLDIRTSFFDLGKRDMIIDSGTTLAYLPDSIYSPLMKKVH